jgi:hypothetical protein
MLRVHDGVVLRQEIMSMGYGNLLGTDGIQSDYNVTLHQSWNYIEQ